MLYAEEYPLSTFALDDFSEVLGNHGNRDSLHRIEDPENYSQRFVNQPHNLFLQKT